jgi:hypothetical protein
MQFIVCNKSDSHRQHNLNEWSVFIGLVKLIFKTVFLHDGNRIPQFQQYAGGLIGIIFFFEHFLLNKHSRRICGDMKEIALLVCFQLE